MPKQGNTTVERLTALGKSFHSDCFRCEVMDKIMNVFTLICQSCSALLGVPEEQQHRV